MTDRDETNSTLDLTDLQRQLTSSSASSSGLSLNDEDLAPSNKDALIERLYDLVAQLSKGNHLDDGAVDAIHSQVDRIELLVQNGKEQKLDSGTEKKFSNKQDELGSEEIENGQDSHKQPSTHEPEISHAKTLEIARSAEELSAKLAATVAEFRDRREEAQHIQDLMVIRLEKAVERIIYLQSRLSEVELDIDAHQSDVMFLRIELQAIEAQAAQYIPRDGELAKSITNWKRDWENVDRKVKERGVRYRMSSASPNDRNERGKER